jgi:hypothetical protein
VTAGAIAFLAQALSGEASGAGGCEAGDGGLNLQAKDLFCNFFADVLSLVAPEAASRLRLHEADFKDKQAFTDWPAGDRREMDLVAAVPVADPAEPAALVLIHVEIEAEARSGMNLRVWQYYMQLRLRHGLPVVSILVNLRGGRPGVHRAVLTEGFEKPAAALFNFRTLSLSGCRAKDYLSRPEPLAWALAALMRPGRWSRAEQKIECLRRIAAAELEANSRFLLGNWVETYLQLDERGLAEYERLRGLEANREVMAMEMTWAEQMEVEYTQKGIEKGIEKGLEKGIAALHRVVLRQLSQRFGAVPDRVRQKVEAIGSVDSLSELAEKVLEVRSIDEMGL